MLGSRLSRRQFGPVSPTAARLLRKSHYDLIARAIHGSATELRAYAARLLKAQDELRFRLPPFAQYIGDLAGVAAVSAPKKETARLIRHVGRTPNPRHALAKFAQMRGRP
jgi:hypothetical protein